MMMKVRERLDRGDYTGVWLVGVSGGRDSVVLLDLLVRVSSLRLVVVHLDHQLRGEESCGDAAFVKELASAYGIEYYEETADVGRLAEERKVGLEQAAREARHAMFCRALRKYGAEGVFLGHHADDQAETILYNLLRGGRGLKGMRYEHVMDAEVGQGGQMRFVRPMLELRRCEIDGYVLERKLKYREDSSNEVGFTVRNRMRHEVLPLLREVMGRDVVPAVCHAAADSMEMASYVDMAVDLNEHLDPQGRIYLPSFLELKKVEKETLLFRYLGDCGVSGLSRSLVHECLVVAEGAACGGSAKCNLPGGGWIRRRAQRLFIELADRSS